MKLLLVALAACSQTVTMTAPPPAHPEPRSSDPAQKPIQDYVDAVNRSDIAAIEHVLVSPARLRQAVTCKPGPHDMLGDLDGTLAELHKAPLPRVQFELLAVHQIEARSLAVGDAIGNCTATEPFETRTFRWSRRAMTPRATTEGDEVSHVAQFDGTWYLLPL